MTQSHQLSAYKPKAPIGSKSNRTQVFELLRVGSERHWSFRVLGVAPVPHAPIFHNQWWLVPIAQDSSPIPLRALERVNSIYEAGIRPKAFVIAHEAPRRLRAPAKISVMSPLEFRARQLAEHSFRVLQIAGKVLTRFVLPFTIALIGVTASAMVGLASVALSDPCLIAVTDDDVWIQIDFWMTE